MATALSTGGPGVIHKEPQKDMLSNLAHADVGTLQCIMAAQLPVCSCQYKLDIADCMVNVSHSADHVAASGTGSRTAPVNPP